jgi:hypothetical protein
MKINNLWGLGIISVLYIMSSSKLFYFTTGVFIGVNYHEHLKPYTDMAQNEAIVRLEQLERAHPELKIPGLTAYIKPILRQPPPELSPPPELLPVSNLELVTRWMGSVMRTDKEIK